MNNPKFGCIYLYIDLELKPRCLFDLDCEKETELCKYNRSSTKELTLSPIGFVSKEIYDTIFAKEK